MPDPHEVLSALDSTGFLFEQHTAQIFRSLRFEVVVNHAFEDSDTGKSREIDVRAEYARYVRSSKKGESYVSGNALIECKNTQNPFVVVGSSQHHVSLSPDSYYHPRFDPLSLFKSDGIVPVSTFLALGMTGIPGNFMQEEFRGTQLVRMNLHTGKWKADNSGVFDTIFYPLAKACKADREALRPFVDPEDINLEVPELYLYYPILVTNGPVYTVDVHPVPPKVKRVPWARLVRDFEDRNLRGRFFMDIVEYTHLSRYIETTIVRYVDSIARSLTEKPDFFYPERLLDRFGEPTNRPLFDAWAAKCEKEDQ